MLKKVGAIELRRASVHPAHLLQSIITYMYSHILLYGIRLRCTVDNFRAFEFGISEKNAECIYYYTKYI
jgi:hypothetical protein